MQPCIRKCWLLENFEKHLPDNGLSFILCFHASLVFEPTFRITVMLRKVHETETSESRILSVFVLHNALFD